MKMDWDAESARVPRVESRRRSAIRFQTANALLRPVWAPVTPVKLLPDSWRTAISRPGQRRVVAGSERIRTRHV